MNERMNERTNEWMNGKLRMWNSMVNPGAYRLLWTDIAFHEEIITGGPDSELNDDKLSRFKYLLEIIKMISVNEVYLKRC